MTEAGTLGASRRRDRYLITKEDVSEEFVNLF
jgi:hypothetical protein